jgi:hypothetical protein
MSGLRQRGWAPAVLGLVVPVGLMAQETDASSATVPRGTCFWAKPLPACRSFILTESHFRYRVTTGSGGQTKIYLTGEAGWMRNSTPTRSAGVSAFAGYDWDVEDARFGLKGRYRWWVGSRSRFDAQAGLLTTSEGNPGVLAGVNYSFGDKVMLTAELDYIPGERIEESTCAPLCPSGDTMPAVYLGGGLGSGLGIASYVGAVALGILALLAQD